MTTCRIIFIPPDSKCLSHSLSNMFDPSFFPVLLLMLPR